MNLLPDKIRDVFFTDAGDTADYIPSRYKVLYGGRGSGKSWALARLAALMAACRPLRVLCVREFQSSIQESIHKLLSSQIEMLGLTQYYDIQRSAIYGVNGSEFIFSGIKNDPAKIKSTEGVDICLVEEAEKISEESWRLLIPTIRKSGSEFWIAFNPREQTDPTYQRFIVNPPPSAIVAKIDWHDNPWFPEPLQQEREWALQLISDANDDISRAVFQADYDHVWDGACRTTSNAQIFRGKYVVDGFVTPKDVRFYFGADWGFAADPTVLIRSFIQGPDLYVDQEVYGAGIELDEIITRFKQVEGVTRWPIYGDSSRPETISYLARHGLNIKAARKWPGSVEDGIAFLRSFQRIIIHPRCVHTAEEFKLYSYKTDKITGEVLPIIIDAFNHCIDGIRYSFNGYIGNSAAGPILGGLRVVANA